MDGKEFRAIEVALELKHAQMAALLGISEISVKRYATGAQPVPRHIARLCAALLLLRRENLTNKFARILAKYHCDT